MTELNEFIDLIKHNLIGTKDEKLLQKSLY